MGKCPITDDDAARNTRFAWYGEQPNRPRSALTELLTCALQPQTHTRSAMTTTLRLTLDVSENMHTGDVHWTSDIKHDEAPLQEPQHQPAPHSTGTGQAKAAMEAQGTTGTGGAVTQTGILSAATISSAIPVSDTLASTDLDSKVSKEVKSTHTPHTHQCGVAPQSAGSIPLHTNILDVQGMQSSVAAAAPTTHSNATGIATPAGEAAQIAPSTVCSPTTAAEIIRQVKDAWQYAYSAMTNVEPATVVRAAADAAMETTARYWAFNATDAVEEVIAKCTQRMPLIFANPALGTVLRTLNPEATAVMWSQTKRQRKAATGSSSYITDVTGQFDSMKQASAAWHDHYQRRKQANASDRYCYNRTIRETVVATGSELEELLVELDIALQHGFSKSAMAVADEAGDGTQCYASACQDQAHRAVAAWKEQYATSKPHAASTQAEKDLSQWSIASLAPEESLSVMVLQIENIISMADLESDADSAQITVAVRRVAEELTAPIGLTAGVVMHMAASAQQQVNKLTLHAGHGTGPEAAKAEMLKASTAISATQLLQQAQEANKSWEESRANLIDTLAMQEAAGCPNWQQEQPTSAKLVVAAAKAAQQELGGYSMATSQPCTMIKQHRVTMAISRLA